MNENGKKIIEAFRKELCNEIADLTNVTPDSLKMDNTCFYSTLKELEKSGVISGLEWCKNGECLYDGITINSEKYKLNNTIVSDVIV